MSRRALSFSSNKIIISPSKDTQNPSSSKPVNLSETKLTSSSATISFISNLCIKLKEKYTSTALGLRKISDQFPLEIPILQFRNILRDLKLKYTEKEFKDFFKIYGKTKKSGFMGITLEALTKCVHCSSVSQKISSPTNKLKKSTLLKTQNFSTRASSKILENSNSDLVLSQKLDVQGKGAKVRDFLNWLIEIFANPEEATDFFFIGREGVGLDEFSESVENLGASKFHSEIKPIFLELSSGESIVKEEFYWKIYNITCRVVSFEDSAIVLFRERLHNMFENHFKAYQELSAGGGFIGLSSLGNVIKALELGNDKEEILEFFRKTYTGCKVSYKDFKSFWVGKEGICTAKLCEDSIASNFSYCKKHIQTLANRGEEIYTKLQVIMKKTQLLNLIQEVLKEDKMKIFVVNGFELHKKDALALKEFLKLHGFNKRVISNSVKNRV